MKSAGNDIVALKFTDQQRTRHSAFYSKFITETEQRLYQPEMPFESFVWLLWSVKEAAYKFLKRNTPDLVFPPSKIIVQNIAIIHSPVTQYDGLKTDSFYTGMVQFEAQSLFFLSTVQPEFIATIINDTESFEQVYWGVQLINETDSESQSAAVRVLLLNKLRQLFPADDLQVGKEAVGYPILLNEDKELDLPVSLAHHGNYVGYSFLKY